MAEFPTFSGQWQYQSFCPKPGSTDRPALIAAPWSPRGVLDVETHPETGKVKGKLVFTPAIQLDVTGTVTPALGDTPASVELIAQGLGSVSMLRGCFLYGAGVLVAGMVVAIANDLAKQPVGTRGAFVLFPGIA